jgi:hypothetical protein
MNKWKTRIMIFLLIIGIIFISGCLKRPGPEKAVQGITTPVNTTIPYKNEPTGTSLSNVKVAVLYERVTDGALYGRSNDDVIKLLKQTKTDLIFRGFWRWEPVPESKTSAQSEVS